MFLLTLVVVVVGVVAATVFVTRLDAALAALDVASTAAARGSGNLNDVDVFNSISP